MPDTRFFANAGPFTVAQLAEFVGAEVPTGADGERVIDDIAPIGSASASNLCFLDNQKYLHLLTSLDAGACILKPEFVDRLPETVAPIICKDPYRAYAMCARAFYPIEKPRPYIAASAHIEESARIGHGCRIDPGAVIGENAVVGDACWIGANVVVGPSVTIGNESRVGANSTLQYCEIGSGVIIHPGACIGQDGFGFAMGPQGHLKVPQLGRVIINDDVEVGAGTTIDRGAGPDTVIGAGTKIDNLVQIGHNVVIGRCCVIVAQVGISGSTQFGDFVVVGGQSGFTGHLKIGDGAQFAARAGVVSDVSAGEVMGGNPAIPQKENLRRVVALKRLAQRRFEKSDK